MQTLTLPHLLPLFALLIWAAMGDVRERRIRNWLTLTLAILGVGQSFMAHHTVSPGASLLGLASGFGLTFILFAMGALGGGDVKLLAGLGAWLGAGPTLAVFCLAAIIGMFIVLGQAAWQGRLAKLLHNTVLVTINVIHVREVGMEHAAATGKSCRSVERPLPYAVPVLIAVSMLVAWSICPLR
ncbi:MAG TPA: A24 family peptidase [Tepidisphaeraceae bacterium]|nr:A24 family peptidase [Tepidisphaeraceae bacterium]